MTSLSLPLIPSSIFLRRKLCIKNVSCLKVSGIPKFQTTLCVNNKISFKIRGNPDAIVKRSNYSIIQENSTITKTII